MSGYGDSKRVHLKSGGRTACGQLINPRTMDVTHGTRPVTCMCCIRTRKYEAACGGNVDLNPIPKNDCPCQRTGLGCNRYAAFHSGPNYYVCRHTGRGAYVPACGGTAHDGMYG